MILPEYVQFCLDALENAGFSAYCVGGCVRDSLLGLTPADFDLCTSATPEQITQVFARHQLLHHGEKHGTVSVVLDNSRSDRSLSAFALDLPKAQDLGTRISLLFALLLNRWDIRR